jgi:hypothetical protein
MPSVHGSNFNHTYVSESGNASEGTVLRRSVRQFFSNLKNKHLGEINRDLNMFYNKVLYSLIKDARLDQIAEDLFVAKYVLMYLNESIDYDTFSELPTIQNKLSELIADFEFKRITKADLETFEKGLNEIYGFISEIREKYTSIPIYHLNDSLIEFYKKHVKNIMRIAQGKPTAPPPPTMQPIPVKLESILPQQKMKDMSNVKSVISNTGSRMTLRGKRKAFLNRLPLRQLNASSVISNTGSRMTLRTNARKTSYVNPMRQQQSTGLKKGGKRTRKYRRSH